MVAIEKGDRPPRAEELTRFANLYGRTVNELLRPTEPLPDLTAKFRIGAGRAAGRTDLDQSVDDLQALLDDYLELERLAEAPMPQRYPPETDVSGLAPHDAGESLAVSERHRLGLGDGPVLQLRQMLETDVGLRVFALALPTDVAGLFAYHPRYGGAIAFSARHPYERQRWTLAHEYGHFLAQRAVAEATSFGQRRRLPASERFAESFAEHFLMPASGLKRRFNEIVMARPNGVTPADLVALADRFKVSLEAMVLRLEALKLLRPYTYDRLLEAGFKVEEARRILELSSAPPDDQLLPIRFRYLAVEALATGDLSEGQAARLLRTDRVGVRELAAALAASSPIELPGPVDDLPSSDGSG